MAMDYNNLIEETIVVDGVEGKIIMIYGGNNLGKSGQSVNFPSPVTFPFEPNALNAIGGARKLPIYEWSSFVDFTDSVYSDKMTYERNVKLLDKLKAKSIPKDVEDKKDHEEQIERLTGLVNNSSYAKFKSNNKTLVIDSLTALGKSAEKYVTDEADVQSLRDGNRGALYERFENEVYHTINKFFSLGDFTYLILAHHDYKNIGTEDNPIMQAIPKGNWKRVVKPVIDRCDIIAYLRSNGADENHKVIPSSAILVECDTCFARSKWENMDLFIEEYSFENLEAVIKKAIAEQAKGGVKVGTFQEQQKSFVNSLTVDHEELQSQIGELVQKLYDKDNVGLEEETMDGKWMTKFRAITEEFLGDKMVSQTNEKQVGQLANILSRTQDLIDEMVF